VLEMLCKDDGNFEVECLIKIIHASCIMHHASCIMHHSISESESLIVTDGSVGNDAK
jgi:hypothetical protein